MPRGVYKRKTEVEEPVKEEVNETEKETEVEVLTPEAPKLEPLSEGQAYFEAPDGTIIVGESSKDHVWYRGLNDGKGGFINKKR